MLSLKWKCYDDDDDDGDLPHYVSRPYTFLVEFNSQPHLNNFTDKLKSNLST